MPGADSYGATRQIRAMDWTDARTVPIIAMTVDAFRDDVQKSKDAGMDGLIAKPIDPAVFYATLASQLNLPR